MSHHIVLWVASSHPLALCLFSINTASWNQSSNCIRCPKFVIETSVFWIKMFKNFWRKKITTIRCKIRWSIFWIWFFDKTSNFITIKRDGSIFFNFFVLAGVGFENNEINLFDKIYGFGKTKNTIITPLIKKMIAEILSKTNEVIFFSFSTNTP